MTFYEASWLVYLTGLAMMAGGPLAVWRSVVSSTASDTQTRMWVRTTWIGVVLITLGNAMGLLI